MTEDTQKISAEDVGSVSEILDALPKPPEHKFHLGQEVKLRDGSIGKVIEVRGEPGAGFSYAVAHGIHSAFPEAELESV